MEKFVKSLKSCLKKVSHDTCNLLHVSVWVMIASTKELNTVDRKYVLQINARSSIAGIFLYCDNASPAGLQHGYAYFNRISFGTICCLEIELSCIYPCVHIVCLI